jgi:hypothetical protein
MRVLHTAQNSEQRVRLSRSQIKKAKPVIENSFVTTNTEGEILFKQTKPEDNYAAQATGFYVGGVLDGRG